MFPVMPYPTFAKLTESDAKAIVSYLRTLKPVESPPQHVASPWSSPRSPTRPLRRRSGRCCRA